MTPLNALDLSFDAVKVTPAWARARLAEGWELLIVNLWTGNTVPDGVQKALQTWREAGGLTAAYVVVHDNVTAQACVARARAAAGDEWAPLTFVAIDVELDPTTIATIRTAYDQVQELGQRPAIYTGRWFWTSRLNDTTEFATRPLWDASYGVTPALEAPGYGGWTARIGHQYQGTTTLDGVAVDLNLFDGDWVRQGVQHPTPPPTPPPPTPAEEWQNVIDVVHGWSRQLAQASHELADVADIVKRLRLQ
jgi:hypothetical protein